MAEPTHIHWVAPFLMFGSLVTGVLFSIGHHLFYQLLNGKSASTRDYRLLGSDYSGQQINTAVGTAFALLVKAALVLAVSTAYFQLFWRTAKSETRRRPTLVAIDRAYSAMSNIISFLILPLWLRYPLLFLLAATAWLLPIASVVAPATLSVDLLSYANVAMLYVPMIDFSTLNFVAPMPPLEQDLEFQSYGYDGPADFTRQIAMAVALEELILPIPSASQSTNSSWQLEFRGPSLKCDDVSASERLEIERNIQTYFLQNGCVELPAFMAWYPRHFYTKNETTLVPFANSSLTAGAMANKSHQSDFKFPAPSAIFNIRESPNSKLIRPSANLPPLYLAALPNAFRVGGNYCSRNRTVEDPLGAVGENATMLKCQSFSSTYHTQFRYSNGDQAVNITVPRQTNDSTVPLNQIVQGPRSRLNRTSHHTPLCRWNFTDPEKFHRQCNYDADLPRELAYQGIFEAFTSLITGMVHFDVFVNLLYSGDCSIRSTGLVNTKELSFLNNYQFKNDTTTSPFGLQQVLWHSKRPSAMHTSGIATQQQPDSNRLLKDTMEKMFQNFTVSLMSSPVFRPNYISSTAPPQVGVTSYYDQTVYVYAADKLWIAYGLAALFTFGAYIVGMLAILANGASYDDSFSTVLRTTRDARLNIELMEEDLDGWSPLPSRLAKATVDMSRCGQSNSGSETEKAPQADDSASARTTLLTDDGS